MKRLLILAGCAAVLAGAAAGAEEFVWSFEKDGAKSGTAAAKTGGAADTAAAPQAGKVDAAAYEKLLRENLEMRKEMDKVAAEGETVRQQNERLAGQIKTLEQRVADLAGTVRTAERDRDTAKGSADRVTELEAQLARADEEKARLSREVASLKAAVSAEDLSNPSASVQKGTSLFRQLERENNVLKTQIARLQTERQKAADANQSLTEKERQAAADVRTAGQKKDTLERELTAAKATIRERDRTIRSLEAQVADLRKESGAGAGAARKGGVEKDPSEPLAGTARELRDLHYNLAVMYAKDGRPKDAENEYLRSLELDPNDADVHYNLGILYDDELRDKTKAAAHYSRFLKLSPHSGEAETVRNWLLKIQTSAGS